MAPLAVCFLFILGFLLCSCSCSQLDAIAPRTKPQEAPRSCIGGSLSRVPHLDLGSPSLQQAIQPGFPIWAGGHAGGSAYPFEPGLIVCRTGATLPSYLGLATSQVIRDAASSSAPTNSLWTIEKASHNPSTSSLRRLKALLLWPIDASKSFILATFYRWFLVELRFIPSRSMIPTLEVNDRVIVEKVSYFFKNPEINDIVLFRPPPSLKGQGYNASVVFIKRVIAKAGDSVEVKEGMVFVNGIMRIEEFTAGPPAYEMSMLHVPKGYIFVLGDNRNFSYDSHIWGPVPIRNILGRAVYRYWPPERAGSILQEEPATSSLHTQLRRHSY